ncbi:hypothetical protein [Flavobacterium branchiicola]|uniref:Lipoprotein n=1 Tax=Flavobacterium branchiicola TaxID=1114875 RepID=A0ABV9PAR2_9FLAO|nr:hypothetical protein [Flavobacterium branchiicola]MBS7252406.1 hypothetical protein [Flavobacterium branchiicola]
MKKILVCLVVVLTVSSCVMKEKMVINEDGSGSFAYGFDLGGIFKMGLKSIDSVKKQQPIDTVFTFKEVFAKLKDSIAKLPEADREKIKMLENFKVIVKANEEEKQLKMDMEYNFPSIDSLKNMISPLEGLEAMPKLGPGKQLGALNAVPEEEKKKTRFSYSYDGKVFEKKILIPEENKKGNKEKKKKEKNPDNDFSKKMDEIFKECKYSIEYHFPKKIKSVSLKNAVIAKDRKSFTMEIPMQDFPDDEEKLGFKVLFEN